jgi:hypothetical protein
MIARSLRTPSMIYLEDASAMESWKRKSQQEREQAATKLLAIHAEITRVWNNSDAKSRLDALGQRAASEGVGQLFVAASKVREVCTLAKQKCDKAEAALK